MEFQGFPKIPRYSRECVITEKIDGTNAQVLIWDVYQQPAIEKPEGWVWQNDGGIYIFAGSRNRWITPEKDNHGFARWVYDNAEDLLKLGPGRHFGEWWGQGIQRGYGLKEKRFSLFNTKKWEEKYNYMISGHQVNDFPKCCHVVPVLWTGPFLSSSIEETLDYLKQHGSYASSGYMNPEGIVIWHSQGNVLFKKTFENDEKGKGE